MTDRGSVVIEVVAGLADVLACRYVAEHTTMVFDDADTWVPGPGDVADKVAHRPGGWGDVTCGRVELGEVNWFDDQALIVAAPNAVWQAFVSRETEQPNLWLAYHPRTGLVEGSHLDHEVMVPATWAHPGARSGDAQRYLARIRAVQALLTGPPPAVAEPGALLRQVHVTVYAEVDDQARIHNWAICEPGAEPTDSDRPVWNPSTEEWEHTDGPEDAHVLTGLAAALAAAPTGTSSAGRPGVTAAVSGPVLLAQPATPGAAPPAAHPAARGSGGRSLR